MGEKPSQLQKANVEADKIKENEKTNNTKFPKCK